MHLPRSQKSSSETKDISNGVYTKQTALSQDRRAGVFLTPIVHAMLAWSPCSGHPSHCQPSQVLLFFVAAQCTRISVLRSRRSFLEVVACLANPFRSVQHRILPMSGALAHTTLPTFWIPAIGAHATGSCPCRIPIRHVRHLATHWAGTTIFADKAGSSNLFTPRTRKNLTKSPRTHPRSSRNAPLHPNPPPRPPPDRPKTLLGHPKPFKNH